MSKTFRRTPARIAALLALCGGTAHAVDDLEFLKMVSASGTILGESTSKGHEGWTAVDGISWKIEAETSFLKGTGAAVGKASPSIIRWHQALDTTVPSMYRHLVLGTHLDAATFDHVSPGSATGSPYLSLGLKSVFFADLSMSTAGLSPAVVAKEFALTYNVVQADKTTKPITANWNIATMTPPSVPVLQPNAALVGQGLTPAAAPGGATQAYLRLGANIAGTSVAKGYENWIPVNTAGWDLAAETSFLRGTAAAVGKPTPGPLTWTQGLDATLLVSLAKITAGTELPQVTLEFVKDAGAGPVTFMQMTMNDVYFTSLGVDGPTVTESVVFKSVSETFWKINDDGTRAKTGVRFDFNIAKMNSVDVPHTAAVAGFGLGNLSPQFVIGDPQPGGVELPGSIGPVPEPQTWVLMLGGGALLLGVARRRRAA